MEAESGVAHRTEPHRVPVAERHVVPPLRLLPGDRKHLVAEVHPEDAPRGTHARQVQRRTVELWPDIRRISQQKALRLGVRQGKHEHAVKLATQLVDSEPQNAQYLQFRADVYSNARQHDKAVADCDAILKAQKDQPRALLTRGCDPVMLTGSQIRDVVDRFDVEWD